MDMGQNLKVLTGTTLKHFDRRQGRTNLVIEKIICLFFYYFQNSTGLYCAFFMLCHSRQKILVILHTEALSTGYILGDKFKNPFFCKMIAKWQKMAQVYYLLQWSDVRYMGREFSYAWPFFRDLYFLRYWKRKFHPGLQVTYM